MKVIVSIPAYNEEKVIANTIEGLLETKYPKKEIIFVDDGSKDGSSQKLLDLAYTDENVKIIKFSRNFGHQVAITAGIDNANGDAVVVIDADLQDPPEVITRFIEKWEEGYDVVYGTRESRKGESFLKKLKMIWKTFHLKFSNRKSFKRLLLF